jgi:hypothetical protein
VSILRGLWQLIRKYPVRAQGIFQATLGVATSFGLGWTGIQVGAVMALTAAILAFFTEQVVTPTPLPGVDPAGGVQ